MSGIKIIPVIFSSESPLLNRVALKPSKIIKVGSVQLNSSFSDQYYFPLSVGMLQAYAQKHLEYAGHYQFLPPIYKFMRIEEASEILIEADVVA